MATSQTDERARALVMLQRAYSRLAARQVVCQLLAAYYDGDHPVEFASPRFRKQFAWLLKARFADNWCQVVVDSKEERLGVTGFRVTADDTETDADAWRIWQGNDMDVQAPVAHREALIHGESYATVWAGEEADLPLITVEHPSRAIVLRDPRLPRKRQAGLRIYQDDDGYECAELFLPEHVTLWRTDKPLKDVVAGEDTTKSTAVTRAWVPDDRYVKDAFQRNPLGVVPMVPITNKPRARDCDVHLQSELWPILPLQDALNKLMVDMLVASEFQAFRQRWVTGLELDEDENGNPINPFKGGPGEMLTVAESTAKFGEFSAADLGNYVKAQDAIIVHVASIGSVPPHYLNASADRLSGESIKAAESGLISKVRRMQTSFGDSHETLMRMAGKLAGKDKLANARAMETVWSDPEIRTEAIAADAAAKRKDIGVPWSQLMEDLQYTPQQIERMRAERMEEALMGFLSSPTPGAGPIAAGATPPAGQDAPAPAPAPGRPVVTPARG